MINVEGDYDEIIGWLDEQGGNGVRHALSHYDMESYREIEHNLNFGIFSIVQDSESCPACHRLDGIENIIDECSGHSFLTGSWTTLEDWDEQTRQIVEANREYDPAVIYDYEREYERF